MAAKRKKQAAKRATKQEPERIFPPIPWEPATERERQLVELFNLVTEKYEELRAMDNLVFGESSKRADALVRALSESYAAHTETARQLFELREKYEPKPGRRPLDDAHWQLYHRLLESGPFGSLARDIRVRGLSGKSLQRACELLREHGLAVLRGKRWVAIGQR